MLLLARAPLIVALVTSSVLSGCSALTRVDAPIDFAADRRLSMISPDDGDTVGMPVTVRWRAGRFDLVDGRHFGVFVDRAPLGLGEHLRWRVCTAKEEVPPGPGEHRGECRDDRHNVFLTAEPSITFACLDRRDNVPDSRANDHTVTIVLLDGDARRIGRAVARVSFSVRARDAAPCPPISDQDIPPHIPTADKESTP